MRFLNALLSAAVLGCTGASAQPPSHPPREAAYTRLVTLLGLDVARADLVVAILENAHARVHEARAQIGEPRDDASRATLDAAMQAIRQEMDRQLGAVLSESEMTRVNAQLPATPRPTRGFTGV
jgi:hypothetical protein